MVDHRRVSGSAAGAEIRPLPPVARHDRARLTERTTAAMTALTAHRGADRNRPRRPDDQGRSLRETTDMFPSNLIYRVALDRHEENIRKANDAYRYADLDRLPRPTSPLRRLVGTALVRAGQRVGGVTMTRPAADAASALKPAAPILRIVR